MPIQLLSLPTLAAYLLVPPGPVSLPAEMALPLPQVIGTEAVEAPVKPRHLAADIELSAVAIGQGFAQLEAMNVRRRNQTGHLGDISWSVSAERRRERTYDSPSSGRISRHRTLAVDAALGWNLAGDWLTARVGAEMDKRPDRVVGGDQAFAKTRSLIAGVGWSHDGQWRLDLALRSTTAQAKSPVARLVDLASGAPRAERQAQVQLSLAPIALGADRAVTLGAQASVGQLSGFDRALAGPGGSRNNGASLFARIVF